MRLLFLLLVGSATAQKFPLYGNKNKYLSLFQATNPPISTNVNLSFVQTTHPARLFFPYPVTGGLHWRSNTFLYHPTVALHPTYLEFNVKVDNGLTCVKSDFACSIPHGDHWVHFFSPNGGVPRAVYEAKPKQIHFEEFSWTPQWNDIEIADSYYIDYSFMDNHVIRFDMRKHTMSVSNAVGDDTVNDWVIIPLCFFILTFFFYKTWNIKSNENTENLVVQNANIRFFNPNNLRNVINPRRSATGQTLLHIAAIGTFFFHTKHDWRMIGLGVNVSLWLGYRFLVTRPSDALDEWVETNLWKYCMLDAIWNCVSFAHMRIHGVNLAIGMVLFFFNCETVFRIHYFTQLKNPIKIPTSIKIIFWTAFLNYWVFYCFENVIPWCQLYLISLYNLPVAAEIPLYVLFHLIVLAFSAYTNSKWTIFSFLIGHLHHD